MYWKHNAYKNHSESHSEKLYSVDKVWKYKDEYYSDYYVPEADTTLKTFGICSRSPEAHILNRAANKHILHYILSGTAYFNGIPVGADIEYADKLTLLRAIEGRRTFD